MQVVRDVRGRIRSILFTEVGQNEVRGYKFEVSLRKRKNVKADQGKAESRIGKELIADMDKG